MKFFSYVLISILFISCASKSISKRGDYPFYDQAISGNNKSSLSRSFASTKSDLPPSSRMNKAELIDSIASGADISKADAKKALNAFVSVTSHALKKGDKIALIGFGTFLPSKIIKLRGRNPQTGRPIKIPAKYVVNFYADRFLLNETYHRYIENYWGAIGGLYGDLIRDITVTIPEKGINKKFFSSQSFMMDEFGGDLTAEDPLLMVSDNEDDVKAYSNYLLENLLKGNDEYSKSLSHEAAHVIQQKGGTLLKSAVLSLLENAQIVKKLYIDEDSEGDGLSERQLKNMARKARMSKEKFLKIMKMFTNVVSSTLKKGDKIALEGFGTFSVSKRAARKGRNPQVGKEIQIAAKNVIKFNAENTKRLGFITIDGCGGIRTAGFCNCLDGSGGTFLAFCENSNNCDGCCGQIREHPGGK